ncbi:MAG: hypothetical protein IKY26_05640 [Erysipelotrichaceae bacterium]|nr:hypothetical protein [Erysipelotrichaceae bacterium]
MLNEKINIEYIEEGHLYLANGCLVPSVSELLQFIFPNKYSCIPSAILKAKAGWGTAIHDAIECYENQLPFSLTPMQEITFEQYLLLKDEYQIEVQEQEVMVHFEDKYAGRLDMIASIKGIRSLVDIKTTAKLDVEALEWQLGLYQLAYGEIFEKHYCLWLPKKDLGRLVEIKPKSKEEILKVLEEYERSKLS